LQVKLNNLENRLKLSKKRPLLNKTNNNKEILQNLFNERRKFYEKADFIVNNDNDKNQVLEKIKLKLNSYAKKTLHKE
jgi:shikimate kinase